MAQPQGKQLSNCHFYFVFIIVHVVVVYPEEEEEVLIGKDGVVVAMVIGIGMLFNQREFSLKALVRMKGDREEVKLVSDFLNLIKKSF